MTDTSAEHQPFQHFSRKQRLIAWVSEKLFDGVTYTVRHGLIEGMRRKGGLGWVPARFSGGTETAEHRFWTGLDLRGKTVYDVGAYHGILTLFFARQASRVVTYEPNGANRSRLQENIRLNGLESVTVRPMGLGSEPSTLTMVYNPLMAGGSKLGSGNSAFADPDARSIQVEVTTLDLEIAGGMPPPDFIKIDIEGWELEALRGAAQVLRDYRPSLFLEMHGETMDEKRRKTAEIVAFLTGAGYRDILHIESGTHVGPENSAVAARGHLYARRGEA